MECILLTRGCRPMATRLKFIILYIISIPIGANCIISLKLLYVGKRSYIHCLTYLFETKAVPGVISDMPQCRVQNHSCLLSNVSKFGLSRL